MRTKKEKWVTGVFAALLIIGALYLLGKARAVLPSMGLEYRRWADTAGQLLWLWVLPLFLLVLFFRLLFRISGDSRGKRTAVCVGLALAAVLFGVWAFFSGMFMLFTSCEEVRVMPGLLAVNKGGLLDGSEWYFYEPEGILFRRPTEITQDTMHDWLTEQYDREFLPVGGGGTALFQDAERPEVQVSVHIFDGGLRDDYIDRLTQYYLQKGYEDHRTALKFSLKEFAPDAFYNIASLPFGKPGRWDEPEPLYYLDQETLQAVVLEKSDAIRKRVPEAEGADR